LLLAMGILFQASRGHYAPRRTHQIEAKRRFICSSSPLRRFRRIVRVRFFYAGTQGDTVPEELHKPHWV